MNDKDKVDVVGAIERAAKGLPPEVESRVLDALHGGAEDAQVDAVDIALDILVLDPLMQSRERIDDDAVETYAESMADGDVFPPVHVTLDQATGEHLVTDGWHRVLAALRAGLTTIKAVVKKGNRGTALLAACAANAEGPRALPRRKADKRKAVETIFEQGLLKGATDQKIADHVHVSKALVVKIRLERREREEARIRAEIASRNAALKGPEVAAAAPVVDVPAATIHAPRDLGPVLEDVGPGAGDTPSGAPAPSEPTAPKAPRERAKAEVVDLPARKPGPQWPAVRDAYEAILVELAAAVAHVEGVETRLLELADHNAFSRFDRSELERAFLVGGAGGTHKVRLALRAAARACPVQTCPTCDGDGCEACHHAGYIPAGEAGQAAVLARVGGR